MLRVTRLELNLEVEEEIPTISNATTVLLSYDPTQDALIRPLLRYILVIYLVFMFFDLKVATFVIIK